MEHIKSPNEGQYTTDREHSHEESDVNVRAILGFGLFLAVSGIIVHLVLWGFFNGMEAYYDKAQAAPNPMKQSFEQEGSKIDSKEQKVLNRMVATFPQPRLQVDDVRDMDEFRQSENMRLNNYVWMDKNSGKVSLPVDRAMELVVERGLPNFGTSPVPKAPASQTSANQQAQPPVRSPK